MYPISDICGVLFVGICLSSFILLVLMIFEPYNKENISHKKDDIKEKHEEVVNVVKELKTIFEEHIKDYNLKQEKNENKLTEQQNISQKIEKELNKLKNELKDIRYQIEELVI